MYDSKKRTRSIRQTSERTRRKTGCRQAKAKPILSDMARALCAVIDVATFGADKYSDRGWLKVENGKARYRDAADRHRLAIAMGETHDAQSKLLHKAHEAWNVLAELDLMLREGEAPSATVPRSEKPIGPGNITIGAKK